MVIAAAIAVDFAKGIMAAIDRRFELFNACVDVSACPHVGVCAVRGAARQRSPQWRHLQQQQAAAACEPLGNSALHKRYQV